LEFSVLLGLLSLLTVCFEQDLRSGVCVCLWFLFYDMVVISPGSYPSVKIRLRSPAVQEKLFGPGHKFWTLSPDIGIDFSTEIGMQ